LRLIQRFKFSKKQRLITDDDYKQVYDSHKKWCERNLKVLMRPNPYDHARLGLRVGKKHFKHATDRNLLKRIVRESFRHYQHQLPALDIVVHIYKDHSLESRQLNRQLEALWQACIHIKS
jgi:ribonuclease P protein component